MSDAPVSPVREGDVIAGKYRVERLLGVGGMGVVVAATHLELEQRVALKFLLPACAAKPDLAARFTREARAAAKIHCEHVARVTDVGTLPNGAPYIVMEYMDGEDLERVLRRDGPFPAAEAVTYILQAMEAIAEAHALGIVHRDLKPANLFLVKRKSGVPIVKVLDFGISKLTAPVGELGLTTTSTVMGSPMYMAPEQIMAPKEVDARVDVWALGVVLYELLSGRRPFHAETLAELVGHILTTAPEPLGTVRPDLPAVLVSAVMTCLSKSPASRFPNVAVLAAAIAPLAGPSGEAAADRIAHVLGVTATSPAAFAKTAPSVPPVPPSDALSDRAGALTGSGATTATWAGSSPAITAPRSVASAPRWRAPVAFVAGCLVVGGASLWWNARTSGSSFASAPSGSTTVAGSPPPQASAAVAASSVDAAAPPLRPAAAAIPAEAPTPRPTAPATVTTTPASRPRGVPPAVTRAPSPPTPAGAATSPAVDVAKAVSPRCRIVSYIDPDGTKRFQRECD